MRLLLRANALKIPLADESVHCVVTSPPYWGLRCYGVDGQLGLERTHDEYVARMVEVFREVRRVLRPDGTCWANLGDNFNEKQLVGTPWHLAFALQADGWYLRSDIIWSKPNPMPESITDRPTKAHEYIFLLTREPRYYYDAEAVREPATYAGEVVTLGDKSLSRGQAAGAKIKPSGNALKDSVVVADGRNRRTVWTIPTQPYKGAHFATFPEKLVEPCILAGTSARGCCPECGKGWVRVMESGKGDAFKGEPTMDGRPDGGERRKPRGGQREWDSYTPPQTLGWAPACDCPAHKPVPAIVLDPFAGSGTTVRVANRLGRKGVGIDLSPEYLRLAAARTAQTQRRFLDV